MNDSLKSFSDRSQGILELVNDLIAGWSYDLSKRKPGISYVDEEGNPVTDLDLACYLSSLVAKRAVINLPVYKRGRAKSSTEGEIVVSAANRHGRTVELRSNQKVWSFGVCIDDANVMTADSVGKARTFLVQGLDGDWHDGWDTIEILPTGLDKEVFDALSGADGKMQFPYFIHPMRWTSLFGKNFRIAKFAADYRIPDRLRFLKAEIKRLQEELRILSKEWPKQTSGPSRKKLTWAYESFLDGVTLTGEYEAFPTTQDGFDAATGEKRRLEGLQKSLRFHVRASEFSWWKHLTKDIEIYVVADERGRCAVTDDEYKDFILSDEPIKWVNGGGTEISKPVWAKDKEWRHGVKDPTKPKGRTLFTSMEMELGVSYRFRVLHKTERVSI